MSVFIKGLIICLCAISIMVSFPGMSLSADGDASQPLSQPASDRKSVCLNIVSDSIDYDSGAQKVYCRGNAKASIDGQDSYVTAETIIFHNHTHFLEALGNVAICQRKEVTTGSAFKFHAESDEYLVTESNVKIAQAKFSCRSGGDWTENNPLVLLVSHPEDYPAYHGPLVNGNTALARFYGLLAQQAKQRYLADYVAEQIISSPAIFRSCSTDKYGIKACIYGGFPFLHYVTSHNRLLSPYGPLLDLRANRFHVEAGYAQAAISGSSPFFLDQYLQDSRPLNLAADVKVAKWLRLAGGPGYLNNSNGAYAVGKGNRCGFDMLRAVPVPSRTGDYPRVGKGWRNGKAVSEPPYTRVFQFDSGMPLYGMLPWVY